MIKVIYIYIVFLFFNCASPGLPQGGPKDVDGPVFVKVSPLNKEDMKNDDKIIIEFDERINPKSIINGISVNKDMNILAKVKGNKIIIESLTGWPKGKPVLLNINRNISDFHSNNINEEIQLIYNIKNYEYCSIEGELINADQNIYNIYIYQFPIQDFSNPIQKINSDINNRFFINYLEPGKYVVISSKGNLDIYNNPYGLSPYNYINLNSESCYKNISIYIDEPLEKKKIARVETINSNLLNIWYDNNVVEPYIINPAIDNGDSIYINIKLSNRLEEYILDPYLYIGTSKLDSISPTIMSVDNLDSTAIINFSEPINNDSLSIMGLISNNIDEEDDWINISYENISPMSIRLVNDNIKQIKLFSKAVQDFSGNKMLDSVKVYIFDDKEYRVEESSLKGRIINPIEENIVVEAKNISLDLKYNSIVKDSLFIFENLEPGKYIFRAYEQKNKIAPLIYFSGILDPYESAAKFAIYRDTVEVRKFWDIEGVNIEFKKD